MRRHLYCVLTAGLILTWQASAALASDPKEPVKAIMAIAAEHADGKPDTDYFSADNLKAYFTEEFTTLYQQVAALPAEDEVEHPFSYDVVLAGRDACPLKDVKYDTKPVDDTVTAITVTYLMPACTVPGVPSETKYSATFMVEISADEALIKDIVRHVDGENMSLVDEMNSMTAPDEVATQEPAPENLPEPTAQ